MDTATLPVDVSTPGSGIGELALELAQVLVLSDQPAREFPIPARLKRHSQALWNAYEAFENASRASRTGLPPAAEWILDNYYVVEQAIQQIKVGMPADYYDRLPKASFNRGRAMPRVYLLAKALVESTWGRFDIETVKDFIRAYQGLLPLRIGEVWALAIMLRLCVLEMLDGALARIRRIPAEASYPQLESLFGNGSEAEEGSPPAPSDDTLVANSIISLRMLATQDWKAFFEQTSLVEGTLRDDPAGVYSQMDFGTRNQYRNVVESLARNTEWDELQIARAAVALAGRNPDGRSRHVGYYLVGPGREQLEAECRYRVPAGQRALRRLEGHPLPAYLGAIFTLTALFDLAIAGYALAAGGSIGQALAAAGLGLVPASASAIHLVNWLAVRLTPPRTLPKLEFQYGIPPEFSTVVAVPSMLRGESDLKSLLNQLENHFIGNADPNIHFALLTDFLDAPEKEMPGDAQLIERAKAGIEQLNARYGSRSYRPFLLLHRERTWNPAEECWMGWERKRGKLEEFNQLLMTGEGSSFPIRAGDLGGLAGVRYVITLDSDTVLPRDTARRLVGTLAHPLNRAEFAPASVEVIAGYTVLQPRVQVRPVTVNQSTFTRVFSGDTAIDLYSRAVSDVYQDLFHEGNYVGKGIYDVAAFERSTRNRAPGNAILSHDLFEGLCGRCGLATDIVLFEDYPPHYLAFADRMHRWARGDWQLLPWLLPRVPRGSGNSVPNPFTLLDRWKILDNLRRSLLTPGILALLACGWFLLPGPALAWTLAALLPLILILTINLLSNLRAPEPDEPSGAVSQPFRQSLLRAILEVVFMPHEALVVTDAILTTLARVFVTRKHLLRWTASAHVVSVFSRELKFSLAWRRMTVGPLFALAVAIPLFFWRPEAAFTAAPFLLGWMLSPYLAARISRPALRAPDRLDPSQERSLRLLARSTWLFFEHFIGPEDHWLPPDHFQEEPRGLVAHRTSPTNIGLLLLSTLAAYDFGYIGPEELALRIRNTFENLRLLERSRGHFLNWYDLHNLKPLPPRYISTVDSGNLAACLLILRQGFKDVAERPVMRWNGLVDTLDMLIETLREAQLQDAASELHEMTVELRQQAQELEEAQRYAPHLTIKSVSDSQDKIEALLLNLVETSTERLDQVTLNRLSAWVDRTRYQLSYIQHDLQTLAPWVLKMSTAPELFRDPGLPPSLASAWDELQTLFSVNPSLEDIPAIYPRAVKILQGMEKSLPGDQAGAAAWRRSFAGELTTAYETVLALLKRFHRLDDEAEKIVREMDFRFLFDFQRRVFHIGYNVDAERLDANHYDLLASEARIASLVAIGKGDVPQNHWLYLARPLTQVGGMRALLSWSGTMFEYLMPALFLRSYRNTLLDQTCRAVIQRQIRYAREKGIPWGMSESSFYYMDAHQVYQYRAFGVPGLGYKRGLGDDLVVAPYASILALPFEPQAVSQNLERLRKLNAFGLYGLYESLDFTPERLGAGQEYGIIRSYMVHHQGMALLALGNFLSGNKMVRRFHADPRIKNVELLLQEQASGQAEVESPHLQGVGRLHPVHSRVSLDPWTASPHAPYPQVHCLTNGSLSTLISAAGSGYSHWRGLDLTRWQPDTTLDNWGAWVYVRDAESGELWSVTGQPVAAKPEFQWVEFFPHRVEFQRRDADISIHTRIAIAAAEDVEIRRVSVTNHSDRPRSLQLTSYGEVILAPHDVERRHPAFNRLFIESDYLEESQTLLFHRRARSAKEKPVFLAHTVASNNGKVSITGFETDRAQFLGIGGTSRQPAALSGSEPLTGATGATLDPVFALQIGIRLAPRETIQVAYVTLAATSREQAVQVSRKYRQWEHLLQAFNTSAHAAEDEMTRLNLASADLERSQKLLSVLLHPFPALRARPVTLAANTLGQPNLWPFAISGDHPILLVRLREEQGLGLLAALLKAHTYWRRRDLVIDLAILNRHETGYQDELGGQIRHLLASTGSDKWLGKRGGIFLLREDQMTPAESTLLAAAARVVLDDEAGPLDEQVARLDIQPVHLPNFIPVHRPLPALEGTRTLERPSGLLFDNGLGGFTPDGREYVIYLEPGQWTPAPWANVIANPDFGFLVTSNGLGCTWACNSGENRLTPWRNDPVGDPPSEAVYLRDEDTGQVWSPTPLPARAEAPYLVRHGAGYSIFEHASHGLGQRLRLFAVPDAPVKVIQLKLENFTPGTRRINVTCYAEWVLGTRRDVTAQFVIPEFDSRNFALLARNPYNVEFARNTAFLAATRELQWITTDRTEFLGRMGSYARPAALGRVGLSARVQAGCDPCAAMQILLWLAPGETKEVTFLLGQGSDRDEAGALISRFQHISRVNEAWESVSRFWDDQLGAVQVQTPDLAMDLLLNRWLMYQALSCRVWGRTALYQSSGAFGFRDQLQDALAFVHARPDLTRRHILDAASRQFEEGDVLHWWHPPSGRGIRTRISDNLLWLPYVTAHYTQSTGDLSILTEKVPYLNARPLETGEEERYGQFAPGAQDGTLYDHCLRAIERGVTAGAHGLPLMGAGDWNDGMNRVGVEGKGESIWLGWFAYDTLTRFARLCEKMGDPARAGELLLRAESLKKALTAFAWDGNWFRRAYFDDGTALGSVERGECQIDSISQSWAVLSGAGDSEHARAAMDSFYARLVRAEEGIILLLDPPFNLTLRDPGYIKGYPPGVRENGGQYTHAALWGIWAFAQLGEADRAVELFRLVNPILHADTPEKAARYRVEPYVVAADVYSVPPHTGRGGWTWYTGSASWMYRLGLEAILGLGREGDRLRIQPAIPKDWPAYEVTYRFGGSRYRIRVENGRDGQVASLTLDGKPLASDSIPLVDDGREHEVKLVLG
ncbi:MAG: glucoamylase family protein [Chloroflexota bacterium]